MRKKGKFNLFFGKKKSHVSDMIEKIRIDEGELCF